MAWSVAACTTQQSTVKKGRKATPVSISDEEQRRHDYYFMEALRTKANSNYTASFYYLQHCLNINPNSASALNEIAQYYLRLSQYDKAVAAMEKAVRLQPDNYWYSQSLASLYYGLNQKQKSALLMESIAQRFPNRLEPLYSLLEMYENTSDYDRLLATMNQLEQKTGKDERITIEKTRIYLKQNNFEKAYSEIESLIEEYPLEMRYKLMLADTYMASEKKTEQAYIIYKEVLEAEPDNAQAMYSLASYYQQTGQDELHQQQMNNIVMSPKVTSTDKANAMRWFIVENEQAKADSTQVIGLFQRIVEQDPDDAQMALLYAQYLLSKNMDEEAIPAMYHALDTDPTNNEVRTRLLIKAIDNNQNAEIEQLCEAGIQHHPHNLLYYIYLAIVHNIGQKPDEVIAVCQKATSNFTADSDKKFMSDIYSIMGDTYHTKGMNNEAFEAYDNSLKHNPKNIGTLNNYAYYLSLQRTQLDKAEEMSYKTVKAEPNNATYLDTYAWILFEKGNYAEARIYIDNAMKNQGDQSDTIVEHCGDIYYMTGDTENAVKYWKQAQQMGSESKTLKRKIERKKYIAE